MALENSGAHSFSGLSRRCAEPSSLAASSMQTVRAQSVNIRAMTQGINDASLA
jgi:hypothetical protein